MVRRDSNPGSGGHFGCEWQLVIDRIVTTAGRLGPQGFMPHQILGSRLPAVHYSGTPGAMWLCPFNYAHASSMPI